MKFINIKRGKKMTCPFMFYNEFFEKWRCSLCTQDCPEATLLGFEYQACSTYIEEMETKEEE